MCFARTARTLTEVARAAGLVPPAFRCPPRVAGAPRTIRRMAGGCVVAVQLRERPFDRVAADMIEGVLVANRLQGEAALRMRAALCQALVDPAPARSGVAIPPERVTSEERVVSGERMVSGEHAVSGETVVIDLTVAEPAASGPGPTDVTAAPPADARASAVSVRSAA
ncbi:MAG: hypothetical protein JWL73_1247 [Actinomycetia bacterium]|nr:hypothetical protein [Actinomycetes bacterium]